VKKADAETRARLLATAQRLFGERGFKAVTVRDICAAAKANVAAVNYHFGDKLGLYREVLQTAVDAMRETTEAAREGGQGRSPEEQLRVFVHVFMHRALAGGHAVHRLIAREMSDPTPALDVLVEQGLRPRIEYLSGVIAELIGCDARDTRVLRCVASVQSQVVAYFPNPIAARLGMRLDPTAGQIDAAARHIAAFSVAGVRAIAASPPAGSGRGRGTRSRAGAA
jgi:AcrR family transcriptional regulator